MNSSQNKGIGRYQLAGALLLLVSSSCHAALAECSWKGSNTTNVVQMPSTVSIPYSLPLYSIFQTAQWSAPAPTGMTDGDKVILLCRKPGDLQLQVMADRTAPNPRGSSGFIETLSNAVNVRFVYGYDTSNSSMWMSVKSPGNTILIPNAVTVGDQGEALNPSAPNTVGAPGTYSVTINKLKALTPMVVTVELEKNANTGSAANFGGYDRVSMRMQHTNWGATSTGSQLLGLFRLSATRSVIAPCDPVSISRPVLDLGSYPLKRFTGVNTVMPSVPFTVSINCPSMPTTGRVYYGFSTDYADSSSLDLIGNLAGAGNASGVAVELLQSDANTRQALLRANDLTTNWLDTGIRSNAKQTVLSFHARMRQTKPVVTPGQINATATFLINYR